MKVHIARGALERIRREALLSADGLETGGLLLGYDAGPEGALQVVRAAGPGSRAVRRTTFFRRDLVYSTEVAEQTYEDLGAVWVGDWHTHPGSLVVPSSFDLSTYVGFLTDMELGFNVFLTVIVTEGSSGWSDVVLTPWVVSIEGDAHRAQVSAATLKVLRVHPGP